jgi:flagellar biosynthesis protein
MASDATDKDVTRRRQHAVALAYGTGDGAPKVVAKGQGLVAEQIIERARGAGVFVHESKELVSLLMEVDLDRQIPPALYRAPPPPDTTRLLQPEESPVGTDASNY